MSVTYAITCILCGVIVLLKLPIYITMIFQLILYALQYIIECPYYTLKSQYLKSFASSKMRIRMTGAFEIVTCVSQTMLGFTTSHILNTVSATTTSIILGIVFLIIAICVSIYMKKRFGLRPKEYTKDDIEILNPSKG